jgi:polyhydroxybutyrate depolymerase
MLTATCDTEEKTSLIHFHGTGDSVLPLDGSGDFPSVDSGISFWVNHNNIDPGSLERTELNGGDVTRDAYSGGDEGSAVVLYTIADGGHVWFSAEIGGLAPNQILWDFLSAYDVDGLIAGNAAE